MSCRRALSSSSVDGVCAMLNHACTILEQDFREVLFSKLRQGFPSGFDLTQAYNYVQSTLTQGRIQSTDGETDKSRAAFLVSFALINISCPIYTLLHNTLTARLMSIIPLIYNAYALQVTSVSMDSRRHI